MFFFSLACVCVNSLEDIAQWRSQLAVLTYIAFVCQFLSVFYTNKDVKEVG